MISKITKGSSFKGLLDYLFSKPGAEFLGGNVVGEKADELASEMKESSLLSNRVQKPVCHFSLSVPPTDKLDELDWLDIASSYMKEMGYDCNKYAVVHHTDRDHDHIHIAACRVREDTGRCTEHDWDYRKSEAVVKKLEVDYNLTPSPSSQDKDRRSPTTGERRLLARTGEDSVRVKLQDTIDDLTADHPTMPELINHLKDQGVNVRISETETGSMGISYELDEVAFKGSQLGKAYSFNGLQKHRGVEYDPERDSDAIVTASSRPPVRTSQNSTTTDSTDGDGDDDDINNGAIAPSNQKVELPGQLPSLPELELELEAGNDEAANNDDETATASSDKAVSDDDERLNYQDISAVADDFEREFIQNRVNERIEQVREKLAAEQARVSAEAAQYRRAEEQRINNIYKENRDNPIFNEVLSDEGRVLFEESIAQENMGAIAPDQLPSNDAEALDEQSSLNHQTALSDLSDQTVTTAQTVQADKLDDDEFISVDPIEENWQPLRSHLIEECCLPSDFLDGLHNEGWVYANEDGMIVFTLRTTENIETGVCVFDPLSESNTWRDLNLDPDVEEKVNGEPSFFWIPPQNDLPINDAIITSDPIETISRIALDPTFGQNSTLYLSTDSVEQLPIEVLQKLDENVVVSLKGDEDGLELASEILKVLPKSQKEELDEAGWNGILLLQERERQAEAEQMQLLAQYQSQQESQMEL